MSSASEIRRALVTRVALVDPTPYQQGTTEVLRHAVFQEPSEGGSSYLIDHLVYFVEWLGTQIGERQRGSVRIMSAFAITLYYRIRPISDAEWTDVDGAVDLAEVVASFVSGDELGGHATCVVNQIRPLGASPDGGAYAIRLDLAVGHARKVG